MKSFFHVRPILERQSKRASDKNERRWKTPSLPWGVVSLPHAFRQTGFGVCLVVVLAFLSSCTTEIDMQNIDPSAKVGMGLSLPVGSITAKMGDFLTDSTIPKITVNEEGIYQFEDTFAFDKQFHPINLGNYFSTSSSDLMMSIICFQYYLTDT